MNWITANEMVEMFKVSKSSLFVFASEDKENKYTKKIGKVLLFNETKLSQILDNRKKMWLQSHEMYYDLNMSQKEQVKELLKHTKFSKGSIDMFLTYSLWTLIEEISILRVSGASEMLRAYHKWATEKIEGRSENRIANNAWIMSDFDNNIQLAISGVRGETEQMLKNELRKIS